MKVRERYLYIYKQARAREKKIRGLDNTRCIKSQDNGILAKDDEIKKCGEII